MSVSTANWSVINHSPLNKSISKQCYSIPKAERFQGVTNSVCSRAFYETPQDKYQRKAGFGYGQKYDFTKVAVKTPAPNVYSLPSDFKDKADKSAKAISFGESRDKMSMFGILGNTKKLGPGPGAYDNKGYLSRISFSFRPRTKLELASFAKVPGPGTYEHLPSLTPNGKNPLSRYKGSCATVINPSRSARFDDSLEKAAKLPGPGAYNPKISITPDGKYFLSTFHSSKCRSIGKMERKDITSNMTYQTTPGPGTYRLPSEFGIYDHPEENFKSLGKSLAKEEKA